MGPYIWAPICGPNILAIYMGHIGGPLYMGPIYGHYIWAPYMDLIYGPLYIWKEQAKQSSSTCLACHVGSRGRRPRWRRGLDHVSVLKNLGKNIHTTTPCHNKKYPNVPPTLAISNCCSRSLLLFFFFAFFYAPPDVL